MLNLVANLGKKQLNRKLQFSDIEKYYSGSNKSLIGLEYERLSLDKNTFKNATYDKLEKIIKHFCELTSWDLIYDDLTIIGAISKNGSSISLEPGCQLEISISPKEDVLSIQIEAQKIIKTIDNIASIYDVIFVGYGISPISCVDDIELLNKRRYKVMDEYLPNSTFGELSQKMMRQTAGIQINVDYKNQEDAFYKLKFLNLIMPFMMGLCSNSPLENNNISDKKSIRAHVWEYTGKERCNLFYKEIFSGLFAKKYALKNYIDSILNIPMIFIERENKIIEIMGKITFKEFMKNGYNGYFATFEDYLLHQSLCFPDIRLKKYIEIRNHDSSDLKMALALCAFYKGLLKGDIKQYLFKFSYLKVDQISKYNKEIIFNGFDFKINNKIDAWKIVTDLFNLSKNNLNASDKVYLEPILNIIKQRKTKADLIIDYEINDAKKLIDFIYE